MLFNPLLNETDKQWKPIIKALETVVGKDGVIRRKEELLTYECDGLTSYRQRPALVVLPRTTEQVAATVKICHDYQIPWVARGAGTGLSGGAFTCRKLRFNCHCKDATNSLY
ncbi:glycolate oxidase, subunit GlcD [Aphanothece sacrum FPU3]|nr:glycolate oxidase, subunit GlcD [Aphanothece sacrum FPU3]